MAAIVGNAENIQIGNDLPYPQSSGSDSLHSSESVLDSSNNSAGEVNQTSTPNINGLSSSDAESLPQKTVTYTQADTQQQMLVDRKVIKNNEDFNEKSKTAEVVATKMDCQPSLCQSVQNKSPLPETATLSGTKDEKKVELEVPLDSKSNCSLSIQNAKNKFSPINVDGTKVILASTQHSDIDEKGSKYKIDECKTYEPFPSFVDAKDKEKPVISHNEKLNKTSTLEDKDLKSNFNDTKLSKSEENISTEGNTDNVNPQETKPISSKPETDPNVILKDLTGIAEMNDGKLLKENNSKQCLESSSNSQTFSKSLSKTETDKSSGVSNISELLSYCSPCRVVVQDFFKELNIDLLELSRNFPVHRANRKRLKSPDRAPILGEGLVENDAFDSLDQTKQAKCYTENSKRRKTNPTDEEILNNRLDEDEDNHPLVSVRNNLIHEGNTAAADVGNLCPKEKSEDNETSKNVAVDLMMSGLKGGNSDTLATENRSVTNSTPSDVPATIHPTNTESSDLSQQMPVTEVPPTVDISDSNDLGLKIVSISSQGSVFFPAFTSDNSENIVFNHSDPDSKLNGQLDAATPCEKLPTKHSPPKCKFHGPNSSPVQNLYKCKKCGLEAKSLSDIQAHMAGSHSEFCMYRCPFCISPLRVKRLSIYNNRPIEFEVLQESSHKLKAGASSTKTTPPTISAKRTLPRHIRIQREKRSKLNYYFHNQRDITSFKNKKVSCQYCFGLVFPSNMSRHQNSKKCITLGKSVMKRALMLSEKKKYQKLKCDSCQKYISRTNKSKHTKICPGEIIPE